MHGHRSERCPPVWGKTGAFQGADSSAGTRMRVNLGGRKSGEGAYCSEVRYEGAELVPRA